PFFYLHYASVCSLSARNPFRNRSKCGQKGVCSCSFFTQSSFATVTSVFLSLLRQSLLDSPENSSVEVKTPLSWTTLSLGYNKKLEDEPDIKEYEVKDNCTFGESFSLDNDYKKGCSYDKDKGEI
ncbi:hypothetical protein TorRG33x02_012680, partial [Trema orientale]